MFFFIVISILLLSISFLFIYAFVIEPQWLVVKKVTVEIDRLPTAFDGFKIVQLSDFHLDNHVKKKYIEKVVHTTLKLKPDLITFTGDMVKNSYKDIYDYIDVLKQLKARNGIYCVFGNHDYSDRTHALAGIFEEMWGNPVLFNKSVSIEKENEHIWIIGINSCFENPDIVKAMHGVPKEEIKIILWHEPDHAALLNEYNCSLQLSGHTHGGQVNLPIIHNRVLPLYGRKYVKGSYKVGNMVLYVNPGIGMGNLYLKNMGSINWKIRFNCRPEISCIILRTKNE